jgi:hypothetical protein
LNHPANQTDENPTESIVNQLGGGGGTDPSMSRLGSCVPTGWELNEREDEVIMFSVPPEDLRDKGYNNFGEEVKGKGVIMVLVVVIELEELGNVEFVEINDTNLRCSCKIEEVFAEGKVNP